MKNVSTTKKPKKLKSFSVYEVVHRGERIPKPLHIKAKSIQEAKRIAESKNLRFEQTCIIPGTPSKTIKNYKRFRRIAQDYKIVNGRRISSIDDTVRKVMTYGEKIGAIVFP